MTLLEKSSALQSRAARDDVHPERYVRHFEDAVHILRAWDAGKLPAVVGFDTPRALAAELVRTRDTGQLDPSHAAFAPAGERRQRQLEAMVQLDSYFWGERVQLDQACEELRLWLQRNL